MALCLFMTCMITFAQKQVTGSVTDEMGKPLIGVSVTVEGTTIGSVTDVNGNFSISRVPDGASLRVSYIGYLEQTIKVGSQSNYYITMHEDNQNLDELVVIGYQAVKKRDLTGVVSSVSDREIENVASANALQAMQGSIPGANITQNSGEAGGSLSISFRGTRSLLASSSPLIIVDGVDYGSTIDINPNDIESIDVLRDASSTAIYGTRGANGVIIITTKRGQSGRTHVTLDAYNSWNSAATYPTMFVGDDEVKYRQEAASYSKNLATYQQSGSWGTYLASPEEVLGNNPLSDGTQLIDIYNNKSYTNWMDEIIRNNTSQNYVIGINGGSDKTNFSISLGLMNDRGLQDGDKLTRYNGKINLDHKINDYFKVGGSMLFTYKDRDRANSGVYSQALKMTSITHARDINGNLIMEPDLWYPSHVTPLADEGGNFQHNYQSSRFFSNVYGEVNILRNLSFRTQIAVDAFHQREGLYQDYESVGRYQNPHTSYMRKVTTENTNWTWDNTLNFNTDFGASQHTLNVLLGHEMINRVQEQTGIAVTADANHYYDASFYKMQANGTLIDPLSASTPYTKQTLMSFFGRINYSFAEKYLLTFSMRDDGSSVLAEGNKWAVFPSVAAAWRITEEPWMIKTSAWLSNLKLRASWGLAGTAAISPYQTHAQLSNYTVDGGKIPTNIANPNLTWEKTSTFDVGLDFGLFNGRVNGSVDFYWSNTKDLLFYDRAPKSSVFSQIISNVGSTSGHGVELSLDADAYTAKDFNWNINFSYTYSTDKIKKLSDGIESFPVSGTQYFIKGERVHTFYDYKADNTWAVGEYDTYVNDWKSRHPGEEPTYKSANGSYGDPGTPKIVDVNDDGIINDDDRVVYNMDPTSFLGLTNTFTYKGISLSIMCYAQFGGYMRYRLGDYITYDNANWGDVDYWTVDNQHAKFPSPGLTSAQQSLYASYQTSLQYEKSDFFKIKDISLGYELPKNWISKLSLSRLKVYASMKNFFSFGEVDDYDSERGGDISFPLQKQVVLGINVEF